MFIGRICSAKNASSRLSAAGDARQDGARIPELDRQAEHAERHQQVGDLRVCDRAEEPLPARHLDAACLDVRRVDDVTCARRIA